MVRADVCQGLTVLPLPHDSHVAILHTRPTLKQMINTFVGKKVGWCGEGWRRFIVTCVHQSEANGCAHEQKVCSYCEQVINASWRCLSNNQFAVSVLLTDTAECWYKSNIVYLRVLANNETRYVYSHDSAVICPAVPNFNISAICGAHACVRTRACCNVDRVWIKQRCL